jgi:hypothetical protein
LPQIFAITNSIGDNQRESLFKKTEGLLMKHEPRQIPGVYLVGQVDHPDFRNAMELVRSTSEFFVANVPPEVVLIAQSRPGKFSQADVESLRLRWPLAGIVSILGSWCEGETRSGRPWPGVRRFYWYEFSAWWRQQIELRMAGRCPEWLQPTTDIYRVAPVGPSQVVARKSTRGVILLEVANHSLADAISDVLYDTGYSTVWHPPGRAATIVRRAAAGIWDGVQLDDGEADALRKFCRSLGRDSAPVVALLDFPRRDRCALARRLGAAAVMGKPWINADLVATIEEVSQKRMKYRCAS